MWRDCLRGETQSRTFHDHNVIRLSIRMAKRSEVSQPKDRDACMHEMTTRTRTLNFCKPSKRLRIHHIQRTLQYHEVLPVHPSRTSTVSFLCWCLWRHFGQHVVGRSFRRLFLCRFPETTICCAATQPRWQVRPANGIHGQVWYLLAGCFSCQDWPRK
jgi:hypothetical protein